MSFVRCKKCVKHLGHSLFSHCGMQACNKGRHWTEHCLSSCIVVLRFSLLASTYVKIPSYYWNKDATLVGPVYNVTWCGALFAPSVSPKLLDGFAKFKRRSIAFSKLSWHFNFIDLRVTDNVTGQFKDKMFHRSQVCYGLRWMHRSSAWSKTILAKIIDKASVS